MIHASVTDDVPWGHICGYPTDRGDLYGGAHYIQSSSADLTPQGRAIRNAAVKFGNGETLPFTPCKKGFIPIVGGERKYACPLHNKARQKRIQKEGGTFRKGEFDLNILWRRLEVTSKAKETSSVDRKQNSEKRVEQEMKMTCQGVPVKNASGIEEKVPVVTK